MNEETSNHHARPTIPPAEELKKLPPDGGPKWNRLVFESSPYLLQHAANPVDWYPWGEEAFEAARKADKPIFLSIGYSTCHWCHVMERESFEDEEVAALLNKHFIAIKVDKEERPDIDEIYMTAVQIMTGSGGWPLTAVLTHDKKPFFTGTYFPKNGRYGRMGMMELLPRLATAWTDKRNDVLVSAEQVTDYVRKLGAGAAGEALKEDILKAAHDGLAGRYDAVRGGFNTAPKFPTPHNFTFLLRYWKRTGDQNALEMVAHTLRAMRRGGIYDHVGFGFHRYATDAEWLVPHFEKMLYDQALLAIAYLETYQATGDPLFAQTAREIFTYVNRDMTSSEGGFYSAEDADSEGEEGKFYVWTPAEIKAVLGEETGSLYNAVFHIVEGGNFVEEAKGVKSGDSIVHLKEDWAAQAKHHGMDEKTLREKMETARAKLFDHREKRIHPFKDDKILTDWNGLMIAAFSLGGKILDEPAYTQTARKAADFIWDKMRGKDGRLLKRYRAGTAGLPAHLDDYAFFSWGLIELYEASFETRYLERAIALTEMQAALFWDKETGGFHFTASDGEDLITRSKSIYDGALPSGNSVSAANLLRLGRITADQNFEDKAEKLFKAFSSQVTQSPSGFTHLLGAFDFAVGPSFEIVLVGKSNDAGLRKMNAAIHRNFLPNKVVVFRPEENAEAIIKLAPYTETQAARNGKATAYVCRNYACKMPTTDIDEMLSNLELK